MPARSTHSETAVSAVRGCLALQFPNVGPSQHFVTALQGSHFVAVSSPHSQNIQCVHRLNKSAVFELQDSLTTEFRFFIHPMVPFSSKLMYRLCYL